MNINVKFLIVAYIVSMFVDWVFQWNWQAVNKSKWSKGDDRLLSAWALASHSIIYAIITTLILSLLGMMTDTLAVFDTLLYSHAFIDSRIPVKWIMRFKGMSKEQISDYQNFGFMHIGIDHRLHEATLLILSMFV